MPWLWLKPFYDDLAPNHKDFLECVLKYYRLMFTALLIVLILGPLLLLGVFTMYFGLTSIYIASHPEILITAPLRATAIVPWYLRWAAGRMATGAYNEIAFIVNQTVFGAGWSD